jgi:hypothetical protein
MSEELMQKLKPVLDKFNEDTDKSNYTDEVKTWVKKEVALCVERMINGSINLRKTSHINYQRNIPNRMRWVIEAWQEIGQTDASLLFKLGLREKITDLISHYYGIDFSGLRVWRSAKDKDGNIIYIAYNSPDCESVTYVCGGEMKFMNRKDFLANYVIIDSFDYQDKLNEHCNKPTK